jgi:hypothetical protein
VAHTSIRPEAADHHHPEENRDKKPNMQVSKALVALAFVLVLSGAAAAAAPRALLRASAVVPAALPHAAAAGGVGDSAYDCCRMRPSCCRADGTPASSESP